MALGQSVLQLFHGFCLFVDLVHLFLDLGFHFTNFSIQFLYGVVSDHHLKWIICFNISALGKTNSRLNTEHFFYKNCFVKQAHTNWWFSEIVQVWFRHSICWIYNELNIELKLKWREWIFSREEMHWWCDQSPPCWLFPSAVFEVIPCQISAFLLGRPSLWSLIERNNDINTNSKLSHPFKNRSLIIE